MALHGSAASPAAPRSDRHLPPGVAVYDTFGGLKACVSANSGGKHSHPPARRIIRQMVERKDPNPKDSVRDSACELAGCRVVRQRRVGASQSPAKRQPEKQVKAVICQADVEGTLKQILTAGPIRERLCEVALRRARGEAKRAA